MEKKEAKSKTPVSKKAIIEEQNELNIAIEQFRHNIKDKYPKYSALKYDNKRVTASEIQALLPENTLLLEYLTSNDKTYIFSLSKDKVKLSILQVKTTTEQ